MSAPIVCCVGKLQIHGDFIRLHHGQAPEIVEFDRWLLEGIERGYERRGRAFEQDLRGFAPLRFVYVSKHSGRMLQGFLVPSSDQVGRTYPFVVGFATDGVAAGSEFDRLPLAAPASLGQLQACTQGAAGQGLAEFLRQLQAVPWAVEAGAAEQALRTFLLGNTLDGLWADLAGFQSPDRRQQLLHELWQTTQPPFPPRYVTTVPMRGHGGEVAFWLSLMRQWLAVRANPMFVAWPANGGPGLIRWLYDELHGRYFDTVLWPEQPNTLALHLGRNANPRHGNEPGGPDFSRLLRPRILLQDVILEASRG